MANDGLVRRFSTATFVPSLLFILNFASPCLAKLGSIEPRPANPFLDPKNDPFNPLKYVASDVLTAIAFSEHFCFQSTKSTSLILARTFLLTGLIIIVALVQSYFAYKWGTKFMLSMVIGEYSESRPSTMRHCA
jgi:hypothetical protein